MSQQHSKDVPFTFRDVASCFSQDEWKLLHEWQKELYKNVMKEIYQAFVSLGPLIASSVFSLRADEREGSCTLNQQDSAGEYEANNSTSGKPTHSDLFSTMKKEDIHCLLDSQNTDGQEADCLITGDVEVTQALSFGVEEDAAHSSADPPPCYEREANVNIAIAGDAVIEPVAPIVINSEDESSPLEEEMMPTLQQDSGDTVGSVRSQGCINVDEIYLPEQGVVEVTNTGNGIRKRRNRERHSEKYLENSTAFKGSVGNHNNTVVPGDSIQTLPGFHPELQPDHITQGDCTTIHESIFSQPVGSESGERTSDDDGPHKYGEGKSNMSNELPCEQQQNTQESCSQYSCAECGIGFTQKQDLLFHQGSHANEKTHLCTVCKKVFSDRNDLIRHQRSHQGEHPYSCTECGATFKHSSTFQIHRRKHTGEKPYECRECGRCFSHKATLVNHKRLHTGEKPYACAECGMRFHQRAALIYHQSAKKH